MITALDVKSGYGCKAAKPYNSILPYLKAKETADKGHTEVAEAEENKEPLSNSQDNENN